MQHACVENLPEEVAASASGNTALLPGSTQHSGATGDRLSPVSFRKVEVSASTCHQIICIPLLKNLWLYYEKLFGWKFSSQWQEFCQRRYPSMAEKLSKSYLCWGAKKVTALHRKQKSSAFQKVSSYICLINLMDLGFFFGSFFLSAFKFQSKFYYY